MKRPLLVIGASYACATWLAFFFAPRDALLYSAALAATGVLFRLLRAWLKVPPALVFVCLSGAVAFAACALYVERTVTPFAALEGKTVEVRGLLLDKSSAGRATTFTMRANFTEHPELPQGRTVRLRAYNELSIAPGDIVRCRITATLPENTAGARYYRVKGIALLGAMDGGYALAQDETMRPYAAMMKLRARMRENLYYHLPDRHAAVVSAMVLGLQDDVPADLYTALNRSGTSHFLAVSGLHLTIITAFILGLLRRTPLPARVSALLALLAGLLFAGLVGFSASVMRAFLMLALTTLAGLFSRRAESLNSLGFALLLLCAVRPEWTLGRSLWLSACSVAGIVTLYPRLYGYLKARFALRGRVAGYLLRAVLSAFSVSLGAYAFTLPILLLSTGWVSLISPFANVLAAPFGAPLILCGALCALPGVSGVLPGFVPAITRFCASMFLGVSEVFAHVPLAIYAFDESYKLILLAGILAGGIWLYLRRAQWDRRVAAVCLSLVVMCGGAGALSLEAARRGTVELAVLADCDTAVLLRDGQAVLLGAPTRYNVGKVLRYLDFRGVGRVSAVVAPESTARIDSGLLRLRDACTIDSLIGPDDAVILSQLSAALPDTAVLSGGYADIEVLGGVRIYLDTHGDGIKVAVGGNVLLKNNAEYGILAEYNDAVIRLFRDGALLLPRDTRALSEPVGARIYGETRVQLAL